MHLSADSVRFSPESSLAVASGNASLTSDQDVVTGSLMALDLATETGRIENGTLLSASSHFTIAAESVEKTGRNTYAAKDVVLTACEGDPPAWRVTGERLVLTMDGYGTLSRSALWIKSAPVFYVPILPFPAKIGRQSGFLPPRIGFSDRQGLFHDQPYFLAIDPHSDATVFARYMSHRGIKGGLEYRYAGKAPSKGVFMFDGLHDRKVDDGIPGASEDPRAWGYLEDVTLRPNTDRYWARVKLDQALPLGFKAEADVDVVSDQDYLREFRSGHSGYDTTSSYLRKHLRRNIDRYDDPIRTSRLNVRKAWNDYSINAEARWRDDVVNRRQGQLSPALQTLPSIGLSALKQQLFNRPLYYSIDTNYSHFYRETGLRHHRMGIHTRIYMPYQFLDGIVLEPSLGLHQTVWYPDSGSQETNGQARMRSRGDYDLHLGLSTTAYRVFFRSGRAGEQGGVKHTIRPRLFYEYAPDVSPNHFPVLDAFTGQQPGHRMTYGVTNILITGSALPAMPPKGRETKETAGNASGYRRVLRVDLQQSYDLESAVNGGRGSFSPLSAEMEFSPTRSISLVGDASWSVDEGRFNSRNIALALESDQDNRLWLEYRHTTDATQSVAGKARMSLSDGWSAYGDYERNILEGETIRQGIGFAYRAQCWSLEFRYSEDKEDSTFEFSVNLLGFDDAGFLQTQP